MLLLLILMIIKISWSQDINEEFRKNKIVPDIITKAPTEWASLEYSGLGPIIPGRAYRPNQLAVPPTVSWNASAMLYYSIILFDPDFPLTSHPWKGVWQCWLVTNIEGKDLINSEPTVHYQQPHPDKDGKHRVVLLIYELPEMVKFHETEIKNVTFVDRNGFSVARFIDKYNIVKLVAGNIFFVDHFAPLSLKVSTLIRLSY